MDRKATKGNLVPKFGGKGPGKWEESKIDFWCTIGDRVMI